MKHRLPRPTTLLLAMPVLFGAAAVGQDIDGAIRNVDVADFLFLLGQRGPCG